MDAGPGSFSTTRLVKLLREQRDLYHSLRDLSQRQRSLVAGDRPELLLDLLSSRKRIVTQLAAINDELAPCRRNWPAVYDQLPTETQGQVSELLKDINGTLQTVLRADQEDSSVLSARKAVVERSLNRMDGGQAVNAAYGGLGPGTGSADLSG